MKLPRFKCLTCLLIWLWVEVKDCLDFSVSLISNDRLCLKYYAGMLIFFKLSQCLYSILPSLSAAGLHIATITDRDLICAIYWLILFIKTMSIIHSITPTWPIHEWPCFRLLLCFYMYWVFLFCLFSEISHLLLGYMVLTFWNLNYRCILASIDVNFNFCWY